MKFILVLFYILFSTAFGFDPNAIHQKVLQTKACGEPPEMNKKIVNYIKTNMGKKIGKGECWDVAAAALNATGAKWDKKFVFGKEVNYKKDCVYPGDIMQLKDAVMHYEPSPGTHLYDEYPQHTAIILEIKTKLEYIVADQNFGFGKRALNTHSLYLDKLVKGDVKIYRPAK